MAAAAEGEASTAAATAGEGDDPPPVPPTRRTGREVEELKRGWLRDPCWDVEGTEGFEAHREELAAFHAQARVRWAAEEAEREAALDREAEALGASPALYRRLLALEGRVERLTGAVGHLTDEEGLPARQRAWRALAGHGEE